ncbi:MAG: hypothetical protein DHS20C01_15160 [marine bacterium B5-7]|nr:MAG: hypothetical protein DHS20C01_15160 [marine bacterium B5-7]
MKAKIRVISALCALFLALPLHADNGLRNLNDGSEQSIEQLQESGKWTIVMIWASDCAVCNREASQYSDFNMMYADDKAKVVGISLDGWADRVDAADFVDRHQVSFENLVAERAEFLPYYERLTGSRWVGTPSFLVYSPDGELKAKQVGAVPVELIEQFIGIEKG